MSIAESLIGEFDNEMATTRRVLERIPEDKFGWKPHEKSMTLQKLASHLTDVPGWAIPTLTMESLDLAPEGAPPFAPSLYATREEVMEKFDKNVAGARAALVTTSDESFLKPWSLLMTGKVIFTMPRIAVMRGMIMNHAVHHRAQLALYLRLNDVPVPAMYGPSADEGSFG